MRESERAFLRAYARLGNFAEAALEASYSEPGSRHVAVRLGIEAGPPGRPQAGSFSDRLALATFVIEGHDINWVVSRLRDRISQAGVFRILRSVEEHRPRFWAVAAVISHPDDEQRILICREKEARAKYGKRVGDVTVPMGFKGKKESDQVALRRVVLREVFSKPRLAQGERWPDWWERALVQETETPIAKVLVVDTLVRIHQLRLKTNPEKLGGFASGTTFDHRWMEVGEVLSRAEERNENFHLRWGVTQLLKGYREYLQGKTVPLRLSEINLRLLEARSA